MLHYTLISNADQEQKVLNFLLSIDIREQLQDVYIQMNFIIKSVNGQNDYALCYNDYSVKLFKDELYEISDCIELEEFLDIIKNSLPQKRIGLLSSAIRPEELLSNPNISFIPAPVRTGKSWYNRTIMGIDPAFDFNDLKIPITTIETSKGKIVFAGKESDNPFVFGTAGEIIEDEPDWVGDAKRFAKYWDGEMTEPKDPNIRNLPKIEEYIIGLIWGHLNYLTANLAMTQFPKETYMKVTEEYINKKLK